MKFVCIALVSYFLASPCSAAHWKDNLLSWLTFDAYKTSQQDDFCVLEDTFDDDPRKIEWVKNLIRTYPELQWFATKNVEATQEGLIEPHTSSWSYRLWGQQYPEFDRAVLSIWSLRALYKGSYEAYSYFVMGQNERTRLSYTNFLNLHHQLVKLLESFYWLHKEQVLQTLEISLALSDLGKTGKAQSLAKHNKVFVVHPTDFYNQTLKKCPHIYPTLSRLSFPCMEVLSKAAAISLFTHVRNLEGNPNVFRHLTETHLCSANPELFGFSFFFNTCDTAAKNGHLSIDGCTALTNSMYRAIQATRAACMTTLEMDEYEAYISYLNIRAQWLSLDPTTSEDRVLTRLGSMLGLDKPRDGQTLKKAFAKLNITQQALVISQFDTRTQDPLVRTPVYIPAVLSNMINHKSLGYHEQERIEKTFILSLPFIAQVLKEHREDLREKRSDKSIPLNFNHIAGIIKDNPYILNYVQFRIDENNKVLTE